MLMRCESRAVVVAPDVSAPAAVVAMAATPASARVSPRLPPDTLSRIASHCAAMYAKGAVAALSMHRVARYASRSKRLRTLAARCVLVNGVVFLGSLASHLEKDDPRARRILARLVDVLTRQGHDLVELGELSRAREVADQAMGLAPFSEGAVRLALLVRALSGDRAEAVSLYEGFAARLDEDLEMEFPLLFELVGWEEEKEEE